MNNLLTILLAGLLLCGCSKKQAANVYPKASWAFAGYASPESALESWTWAFSNGDKTNMFQSLTPEAQKEWEKMLAGMTDEQIKARSAGRAAGMQGYAIQKREVISDDEVVLYITPGKGIEAVGMQMKKIGNDWKVAGPKGN